MRIVFLGTSLEPGRDGVGDYLRRLAGELIRQEIQVAAIGLYDRHSINEVNGTQPAGTKSLAVLRLPSCWPAQKRFERAKEWLDAFNPDWVSLQYSPFAFQDKGLPLGLSRHISSLVQNRRLHIMFHELWVGIAKEASMKFVLWGWLQKQLIHSLTAQLKPVVVHTQSQVYQAYLIKLGFSVDILPLFSNIAVTRKSKALLNTKPLLHQLPDQLKFVVFGSIHPNAPVHEFTTEVSDFCRQNQVKASLTFVGRCGNEQEHWINEWSSAELDVNVVGEQLPACISAVLADSSVGIGTTALALIEKSGSVAAMLEHNLPVLCVSESWHPRGIEKQIVVAGVTEYVPGNIGAFLSSLSSVPAVSSISSVANQFIRSLYHESEY